MRFIPILFLIAGLAAQSTHKVVVLTLKGTINPVSQRYIEKGLEQAQSEQAEALVLRLDTPGGLMSSMEEITKAILSSPVPVIGYVSPPGARAASAGTYIMMATHIAAMAPNTRIGAAHPVSGMGEKMDSTMTEKVTNDAVALIVGMAKERGRNVNWVEQAVRKSVSIDAATAEGIGVVEIIASSLDELLEKCNGRVVKLSNRTDTLRLGAPHIIHLKMSGMQKILFTIVNPNVAYLLMMLGILGIVFELKAPGTILPGVIGGISILLALYAFQIIPINYAGVLLIVLAIVLFILEVHIPSFGILTIGGVVSMLAGSFLLTQGNAPMFTIDWDIIVGAVAIFTLFIIFVLYKIAQAYHRKPVTGDRGMIGLTGKTVDEVGPDGGRVFVHSEIWNAVSKTKIEKDKPIKVVAVDGFTLTVEPVGEYLEEI